MPVQYINGRPVPLPIIQGGTGSTTKNFVDLTTNQSKNAQLEVGSTVAPTHSLTIGSTGNGEALYNTVDQVTNFERGVLSWVSNILTLQTSAGGTGVARQINIVANSQTISVGSNAATAKILFSGSTGLAGAAGVGFQHSLTGTAGTQYGITILPTSNQSLTAGYTAIFANVTETSIGSGPRLLMDLQVGGTSKSGFDNTGSLSLGTTGNIYNYNVLDSLYGPTNYERGYIRWSTNILTIGTEQGGTGSNRSIQINAGSTTLTVANSGSASGLFRMNSGSSNANTVGVSVAGGTWSPASGTSIMLSISPAFSGTGTSGYTGLLVNPTDTGSGTGTKLLADFQLGGTSKVNITPAGVLTTQALALVPVTVTTSTTIPVSQGYTRVNSASATSQTLPSSPATGTTLYIKNVNTGVVSIVGTLDGSTTYQLATQYKYVNLIYNGTSWDIIGNN